MPIREEIIKSLVEKCENELDYYDIVNESAEMVEFQLIVEFIVDCILDVWRGENAD